jgi:hypothetical protein
MDAERPHKIRIVKEIAVGAELGGMNAGDCFLAATNVAAIMVLASSRLSPRIVHVQKPVPRWR